MKRYCQIFPAAGLALLLSSLAPAQASEAAHYLSCSLNQHHFTVPLEAGDSMFQTKDSPIYIDSYPKIHVNATVLQAPKYSNLYKYISLSVVCSDVEPDPFFTPCTKENAGKKYLAIGPQTPEEATTNVTRLDLKLGGSKLMCDLN